MTDKLINMQAFMDTAEWDAKTRSWSISDAQLNRLPTIDAAPVVHGRWSGEETAPRTALPAVPMSEISTMR